MHEEKWKDLQLYPNFQISNLGRVKNIKTSNILKPRLKNGYFMVNLKNKTASIHRLMALEFIENPENYPIVNHIDGNKTNNKISNLEWTTQKQNVSHSVQQKLITSYQRPVIQYSLEHIFIKEWESITIASKFMSCSRKAIYAVCVGENKTAKGFLWEYKYKNIQYSISSDAKIIEEYPNYVITKDGAVFNLKVKKPLKIQTNNSGYQWIQLCNNNKKKNFYIHTLVATYYLENPENKKFVNHKDGIKSNNHITNLEWVTHSENIIHYYQKLRNNSNPIPNLC